MIGHDWRLVGQSTQKLWVPDKVLDDQLLLNFKGTMNNFGVSLPQMLWDMLRAKRYLFLWNSDVSRAALNPPVLLIPQ